MKTEEIKEEFEVGKMNKHKVLMEDGARYLIYYTFGESVLVPQTEPNKEENV